MFHHNLPHYLQKFICYTVRDGGLGEGAHPVSTQFKLIDAVIKTITLFIFDETNIQAYKFPDIGPVEVFSLFGCD